MQGCQRRFLAGKTVLSISPACCLPTVHFNVWTPHMMLELFILNLMQCNKQYIVWCSWFCQIWGMNGCEMVSNFIEYHFTSLYKLITLPPLVAYGLVSRQKRLFSEGFEQPFPLWLKLKKNKTTYVKFKKIIKSVIWPDIYYFKCKLSPEEVNKIFKGGWGREFSK